MELRAAPGPERTPTRSTGDRRREACAYLLSRVQLFATLPARLLCPGDSSGRRWEEDLSEEAVAHGDQKRKDRTCTAEQKCER